jgi:hypothetical protein
MTGTKSQVEWAGRIKLRVNADFDRVAAAFRVVAEGQDEADRADTEAILGILEEKRAEAMGRHEAGYFIHDWQEITGQVRQLIFDDARYQAIQRRRAERKTAAARAAA